MIASADVAGLPVRATLYAGDALSGVTEIYGRSAEQIESALVDVELLPLGCTTAVTAARAELQPVVTGPGGASRGARIDLPLEGVPPGEYVVRATVRAGGETAAELLRDVTILPGARPVGGTAAPANVGFGFLIDNLVISSGPIPVYPTSGTWTLRSPPFLFMAL